MTDLYKLWENKTTMPVITVEYGSGKVLMLGYMNKEAFAYTLKTRRHITMTLKQTRFINSARRRAMRSALCRLTLIAAATLCS